MILKTFSTPPTYLLRFFSRLFAAAFMTFACSFASASFIVTDIEDASNYELGSATATPVIYGGVTGALIGGCASPSTGSTCNNCNFAAAASCNTKRVHDTLSVSITIKVTATITGSAYVFTWYSNSGTDTAFSGATVPAGAVVKDSTATVTVPWSELCDITGIGTTCEAATIGTEGTMTMYIGIGTDLANAQASANRRAITVKLLDPDFDASLTDNNTLTCTDDSPSAGICGFKAYPGDEKVYIADLNVRNTCPATFKKARIFYSTSATDDILGASYGADYVDLSMSSNCNPTGEWIVPNLVNGTPYYFRSAMVDIAGNSVFLIDDAQIAADQAACVNGDPADDDVNCNYIATPGTVIGLLPEDFNCFIATAAYNSGFAPKLKELRNFRNRFLLTHEWGRAFTKAYYKYGPLGAKYISERPFLKKITRVALQPIWAFAWMSLHYGFLGSVLWLISVVALVIFGVRHLRQPSRHDPSRGPL